MTNNICDRCEFVFANEDLDIIDGKFLCKKCEEELAEEEYED